ncbi:PIG-L deacetylase family protein [Dictyobacter kobayashii]|nr:PIG-L family deacetylase [Dictyobacter kobayashii]
MSSPLKLMFILAHPDDESLALGGTIAKYAAEGVETTLVVATRGERGWFSDWKDYPGEKALGEIREQELRRACQALGIKRLDFLNYIDGDLDQAEESEAIFKIVTLLRTIRPHVVVTFGPEGLYGHPDHIAISQLTTSAVMCAASPYYPHSNGTETHSISKLYYRVSPEEWFTQYMPIFGNLIMTIDGQERRATSWVNWSITTRLDTRPYWQSVWQAIQCHQTQIPDETILQRISEQTHQQLWGTQEYYRVFSLVNGGRKEEHDLFEGLRLVSHEKRGDSYSLIFTPIQQAYQINVAQ